MTHNRTPAQQATDLVEQLWVQGQLTIKDLTAAELATLINAAEAEGAAQAVEAFLEGDLAV